ncbi:cysteine desulfurase family protein [Rummeliibacillus stabekisii]|uniref:cysteine desulfurase family protein n=1 Tax=Rummeliibacillus stabekisii TaxID=241244 RepID=UPI00116F17C5|nr:cysteine desulfurase family protein [Rummeliibacillus stabekisii]MBB5169680.1 cysteine desulfurase [Rummeliibacillus stabekisii]GEL03937.1 cysteine desulfurase [Rummeliibacillus stabekisii]
MKEIYLDHAATTPMHPLVISKMVESMESVYGNPSSIHRIGRFARKHLDDARHILAKSIGAKDQEIIVTGGGSEADNLAITGTAYAKQNEGRHIITTVVEHHAVLHTCQQLEKEGYEVTYLPVDETGRVSLEDVKKALRDDTILVTIMFGNNEVGTIQPIKEIGELLKEHSATFHTDAVQAFGILPIDVNDLHVDLLSVSSHKLNGPKGIGFLYQRDQTKLKPLIYGGEQERKRRAGTENVPAVVGFAEAVAIAQRNFEEKQQAYKEFHQHFLKKLDQAEIDYHINGNEQYCLPHVMNISFKNMDVESFLVNLDMAGIAASSGSACTAGSIDPSHVLVAMYGSEADELRNSIRYSFGYGLDLEDIDTAAERTIEIVKRLAK